MIEVVNRAGWRLDKPDDGEGEDEEVEDRAGEMEEAEGEGEEQGGGGGDGEDEKNEKELTQGDEPEDEDADTPLVPAPAPDPTPAVPPKRGRGRPRKHPRPDGGEEPRRRHKAGGGISPSSTHGPDIPRPSTKPFPKPFCFHFKTDNAGNERKPAAFFRFMKECFGDKDLASRIMIYVYRVWPIMMKDCTQQDKRTEVLEYGDIERLYGVGDYHFKLNDVEGRRTVAMCTVTGFRDDNYPAIMDYTKVDMNDPLNQSFIQRSKARGIKFPGMAAEEEEENNMATVQAVETLTSSLNKMTDKMIGMAERREPAPAAQAPSMDQEAVARGLDIVAQAANMGNTMLQQAVNRVTEQAGKQVDPMEMLAKTMTMTRELLAVSNTGPAAAAANDHSQIIEIMKMQQEQQQRFHSTLFDMQNMQISELKAKLEAATTPNNSASALSPHQPKSLIEQINEMKEVKDTMREVLGLGEEQADKGSWFQDNLPMIIQGLSVLGSVITTGLHNLAVIKSGQGVPAPAPGPDAILTEEQKASLTEHGIPVGGHSMPGMGHAPAQNNGQPGTSNPTMEGSNMEQYQRFLAMIKTPLLKSFQEGEDGAEFAEKLIILGDNGLFGEGIQGLQIYDMVTGNGKAIIMALIKTYPPIWSVVSLTPVKWEQFMTDFFDAKRILAERDAEDEAAAREGESAGAAVSG